MFIFRLLIILFLFFASFILLSAALLWLRIRLNIKNPFINKKKPSEDTDKNIIEGEYKIIDDDKK